jgi:hypothetical protein
MHRTHLGLAAAALVSVGMSAAAPNTAPREETVTGTMTVGDQVITLTHAYAYVVPDPFDKSVQVTRVLVTDREIPDLALFEEDDAFLLVERDALRGVRLDFNAKEGSTIIGLMTRSLGGSASLTRNGPSVRPKVHTASRIEAALDVTEDIAGTPFRLQLRFATAVTPPPAQTEPTAAEIAAAQNAAPTRAYLALNRAIHAGDKAAILAAVEPERRNMLDAPGMPPFAEVLKMMQGMTPKTVKVLRVTEATTKAVLIAEAPDPDGKPMRGRITLVRGAEGQWYMAGEQWGK